MCDNAINKHHNPDYGGLPGTMDISNTVNVRCIPESPIHYEDFIQSIRDRVQYTLVWERKQRDIPDTFKIRSDYHINARYFSEYTPTEREKPKAEDSARILIVPASFHHSLDHGPYHNMTSAEFTSDGVDPETNENSPEKKPNPIPLNHIHNSSPKLFAEASASGWQHHTVFVYVKRRPATQLFLEWAKNPAQPLEAKATFSAKPTIFPGLSASRLEQIDAEMERCQQELAGLGATL